MRLMRIALPAAALAVLLPLVPVRAETEVKLGYVDLQRALNEVDEGKSAKAQLKRDFDEKQKRLDREQDELKRMKADFDKQAVVMSDQAKKDKQTDLDRKFVEVQGLFVQLQKELSEREREVTRGIFDKMGVIIREIAEADGFTVVFEKTDAGILYAPVSLDLTNELIRKYNVRHKGGTGAAVEKKASAEKKPAAKK